MPRRVIPCYKPRARAGACAPGGCPNYRCMVRHGITTASYMGAGSRLGAWPGAWRSTSYFCLPPRHALPAPTGAHGMRRSGDACLKLQLSTAQVSHVVVDGLPHALLGTCFTARFLQHALNALVYRRLVVQRHVSDSRPHPLCVGSHWAVHASLDGLAAARHLPARHLPARHDTYARLLVGACLHELTSQIRTCNHHSVSFQISGRTAPASTPISA
jgi:hypothetical protein